MTLGLLPEVQTIYNPVGHVGENALEFIRAEFNRMSRERDELRVQYDELKLRFASLEARYNAVSQVSR